MVRFTALVALLTVGTGVLVLLDWFGAPIRAFILLSLFVYGTAAIIRLLRRGFRLRPHMMFFVPLLALTTAAILILAFSGTTEPIRSPWPLVPNAFIVVFAALIFVRTLATFRSHATMNGWGVAGALTIGSLVAILVYPLGFGFDHFIHVAAERLIMTNGALSPPPFFYSAHYGLVTLLGTIGIPVALADRLLVPLLAAALLIPLTVTTLRTMCAHRTAALGISAFLIVPFLPFAVSTPQALSYIFGVATILLLLRGERATALLTAIASLLGNPLSGIPAAATVISVLLFRARHRFLGFFAAIGGIIALPVVLRLASWLIPSLSISVSFSLAPLWHFFLSLRDALEIHAEDFATADAIAIARLFLPTLWIVLTLIGARRLFRQHVAMLVAPVTGMLITLGAALAVFLTTTISTQLPSEQSYFPIRLLVLAALFALPLVSVALGSILDVLHTHSARAAGAVLLSALASFNLLLAYPRNDVHARSGLWSVSTDDIAAVHAIAEDAESEPFVVLANQMLGAAAVREFQFQPSYQTNAGEVMAFPLPAGGPVAQQFWQFVSAGSVSREPVEHAMELVDARRAYVVLHDYWTDYQRLAPTTAALADAEIGSFHHIRVFRFMR